MKKHETSVGFRGSFGWAVWMWVALGGLVAAPSAAQPVFLPVSTINDDGFAGGVELGEDGGFVATFLTDTGLFCRRFNAHALPSGLPIPVNAATLSTASSMTRDAAGRFVVVWSDPPWIWGRRFASDGTPFGAAFPVNTSTTPNVLFPQVASDRSGRFVVTWQSYVSPYDRQVMARRFGSGGEPLGDEFLVNVSTSGYREPSGVAASATGFAVAWYGEGESGTRVHVRRFDWSGAPMTGEVPVSGPMNSATADVAMSATGDFVVVWGTELGQAFARRFESGGSPLGGEFLVSGEPEYSGGPRVTADAAGNFLVVWAGDPYNGLPHIRGRFFDAAGDAVDSSFVVVGDGGPYSVGETAPHASLANDGSFVVAWNSLEATYDAMISHPIARRGGLRASSAIEVDPAGNGVFEPGETPVVRTAWANDAPDTFWITGTASRFTGPPGADYTLGDDTADYGPIGVGQSSSCLVRGDCYSVTVSDPDVRPARHWDAQLHEALNVGLPKTWALHLGKSFPDVPPSHAFYRFVETLFHNGVTGGCFGGGYCPDLPVTRAQMAVFLLKAKFGAAHVPPPCTGTVFTDVSCASLFDPWIEELAALRITGGCDTGLYCPNTIVTRDQMAVLLLKALQGDRYRPPACTGLFADVPCETGASSGDWIEELYRRQITGGCGVAPLRYCPSNSSTRGQMAAFLTKTFGLVLYGGR